ncbi:hypothetical protein ACKKBG_A20125 [Auxenochlorella protothecoides x Auxenochlorella symbiontica]
MPCSSVPPPREAAGRHPLSQPGVHARPLPPAAQPTRGGGGCLRIYEKVLRGGRGTHSESTQALIGCRFCIEGVVGRAWHKHVLEPRRPATYRHTLAWDSASRWARWASRSPASACKRAAVLAPASAFAASVAAAATCTASAAARPSARAVSRADSRLASRSRITEVAASEAWRAASTAPCCRSFCVAMPRRRTAISFSLALA